MNTTEADHRPIIFHIPIEVERFPWPYLTEHYFNLEKEEKKEMK